MSDQRELWTEVDEYLAGLFLESAPALDAALETSAEAGLPSIAISPNHGKLLSLLAQIAGARRILEIGTLGGYSTIWLAKGLPPDGELITLELDPQHADVARSNVERAGFGDVVDVRVGAAAQTLARMIAEDAGPFDFVFIDADKPSYSRYLESIISLARAGTLIVADNVVRDGAVLDGSSNDADVQGVREFLQVCSDDPRLSSVAIQTVGTKGYDGMALVRVVTLTAHQARPGDVTP